MLLLGEDLPPAKKALSATASRRDQLLLVECDRSPCGNDAVTNSMEQQDWSRRSKIARRSGTMAEVTCLSSGRPLTLVKLVRVMPRFCAALFIRDECPFAAGDGQ